MTSTMLDQLVRSIAFYLFAAFSYLLYLGLSIQSGSFFKKNSEQDNLQFAIERDRFWNLTKSPLPGFRHRFYTLRNGLKLHYISNRDQDREPRNLVIFFHGFPDTSVVWRHLMQEPAIPMQHATLVCVDLPGYGGSDSFAKYDTQVLEALTEFVIAMREKYLPNEGEAMDGISTIIVGHDWGCVLAFRLAAEAPCLADRFILTNGPHAELGLANKERILNSSTKIFKQFKKSPYQNFGCLSKTLHSLKPLLRQILLFGYIFCFNLPPFLVKYLGLGGNFSFLRGAQRTAYGKHANEYRVQEAMASTFGPGPEECKTSTSSMLNGVQSATYGKSVQLRANSPGEAFWNMTGYYRDGVAFKPWMKSLETLADLYTLDMENSASGSPIRRRSSVSSSAPLFVERYRGALRAPAFILWGKKDQACTKQICLDGIGDYLAKDSEVTVLPRSGHWTPIEQESRAALARVIGLTAGKDAKPISKLTKEVEQVYEGAYMMARR